MKHSDSISSVQLAVIIVGTVLGITILPIPRFVIEEVNTAAPLVTLVGIVICIIGILAISALGQKFSKSTLIGYSQKIMGKRLGNFFSIVVILFFIILMGLETRQFAEVLKGGLLPDTPIQISIFLIILICISISFNNVSTFAYIHFFYLPFIIAAILLVLIPSFGDVELYRLLPILGHNLNFKDYLGGTRYVIQALGNFLVISMIIPYMKNPKKSMKSSFWGLFVGGVFLWSIITMSLAVFGDKEVGNVFWPTLILARMVQVPGDVLARIDAIFIVAWIFAVFTTLLSYYFLFVRGIAEMFSLKKYRLISLIGAPLVFVIAIVPDDIYVLYSYIVNLAFFVAFSTIVYPILLLLIAKLRNIKGDAT